MKSVSEWQKITFKVAEEKGFYLNKIEDGTQLMLIVSEASEALESLRNKEPILHYENGKPEGLGPELADIILRTLQYAEYKGIDLETMMEVKHSYNETRPFKHGGKAF